MPVKKPLAAAQRVETIPWRIRGTVGSSSSSYGHSSPSLMPAHLISMVRPCLCRGGARVAKDELHYLLRGLLMNAGSEGVWAQVQGHCMH